MAKQQILLVDADPSSARLLEVSLRSAGFTVATAASAESALGKLEHGVPDLILTDVRLPGADGFAFVKRVRARPELAEVPVVFLTEQGALDDKLRGLELGVDDYLAKPIMVREVISRVQLLLARKKQQRIAAEPLARTPFSGSLEDVAVVDLLQTIAVSAKSGVASLKRGDREARLFFDRGQIIDAEVGDLAGEEAVYRLFTWTTGTFELEFRAIERARVIEAPPHALLMEGLRRMDELGRLAEQLPPENAIVDIDHEALASRLNEIPDELNGILRLIDGKRTLVDLIDASPFDDLSTLTVLAKFYFEGLLRSTNPEPVEWAPGSRRLKPAPLPARAPVDAEAKLTPKGIVIVGEDTLPPKPLPSPFRVANDAPRRSPVPMPAGSLPRANGVAPSHAEPASRTNGGRASGTKFGLSATPVQRPEPAPASAHPAAHPASRSGHEPDVTHVAFEPAPASSAFGQGSPRASDDVPGSAPDSNPGSAPDSNPESEQEFFEAGDEGTYEGGPRSSMPVPHFEHDLVEPEPAPASASASPRSVTPSRYARARRSMTIVAGVLGLAAAALIVAAWRHFATEQQGTNSGEPSALASEQVAPEAVQPPGNTGGVVASPASAVSPLADTASIGADAGPPLGADGSAPLAREVAPVPAAPVEPIVQHAVSAPAQAPPTVPLVAAPRPRVPARNTAAPIPARPITSETPVIPPSEATPLHVPPQLGEKPPTAAYPLH
jgi:DNA-binding response OmpR family regulator